MQTKHVRIVPAESNDDVVLRPKRKVVTTHAKKNHITEPEAVRVVASVGATKDVWCLYWPGSLGGEN